MLQKAADIYRSEGILRLFQRGIKYGAERGHARMKSHIQSLYQRIRSKTNLRNTTIEYNGVCVKPYRTLDPYVPTSIRTPNQGGHKAPSKYETGLVTAMQNYVNKGDRVTVIGGGLGVTAVVAAKLVGESGKVTIYEGAKTMIEHIYDTLSLNEVTSRATVKHTIVANDLHLEGDAGEANAISPADLPPCDILEMDCEGAETAILSNLDIQPRVIIIETHWNLEEVKSKLAELGYSVVSETLAETGPYEEMCKENNIRVIVAKR